MNPHKIYKYPMEGEPLVLAVPMGSVVLAVKAAGIGFLVWIEHPSTRMEERLFVVFFGTGFEFELPDNHRFIQTVFDGSYVWHFYSYTEALDHG